MLRTLNVRQAVDLFFELEEQEGEICVSPSESESDCDDEVEDPSFVTDDKRDDEQPGTSTAPARGSGRGRQRGREKRCRSRSPCDRSSQPHHSPEAWRTESDPDTAPGVSRFMPHRPPGAQKVADDKGAKAKKGGAKGKKDDGPAQNGETKTNEVTEAAEEATEEKA